MRGTLLMNAILPSIVTIVSVSKSARYIAAHSKEAPLSSQIQDLFQRTVPRFGSLFSNDREVGTSSETPISEIKELQEDALYKTLLQSWRKHVLENKRLTPSAKLERLMLWRELIAGWNNQLRQSLCFDSVESQKRLKVRELFKERNLTADSCQKFLSEQHEKIKCARYVRKAQLEYGDMVERIVWARIPLPSECLKPIRELITKAHGDSWYLHLERFFTANASQTQATRPRFQGGE